MANDDAIKRLGRPRTKEAKSSVSSWIPATSHERLASISRRHDVSVSALVRRAVFLFLKDESSGPRE
jgi:hypothetical protein